MVFDQIAKAAEQNHGLTLQPLQVQELLDTILRVQQVGLEQAARLKMAVQLIETLVRQNDGTLYLKQEDVIASEEGFWMRNVDGTIRLGLGTPPEAPLDDEVEAEVIEDDEVASQD